MKASIEKLQKFFKQEAKRNYDNGAVMGGLAKMLEGWEAEARADGIPDGLIQAVTTRLRDYQRLSQESRKDALKGLWTRIRREIGGEEPPKTPPQDSAPKKAVNTQQKPAKSAPPKKSNQGAKPSGPPSSKPPQTPKPKPRKPAKQPIKRPKPEGPKAALDAMVTVLDGVGPKNAEKLEKLGIQTLRDMLYHYPRRYDDYSQMKTINRLKFGEEITIIGTVQSARVRPTKGGKLKITEVVVTDGSGALRVNWFNQPWLTNTLKEGVHVVISGKVEQYLGRLIMSNPEWELLEEEQLHTNRIVPVYPLTANITQRWLRGQMNKVVNYWALRVQETLPQNVIDSAKLLELPDALLQIHYPDSNEALKAAQDRLAFDEIFYLQMGVQRQKQQWAQRVAQKYQVSEEWLTSQKARLPYQLTSAQDKAISEIRKDLNSGQPMNRLLQGDVGSGKTVVAAFAIGMVLQANKQAAILAPTSILAEQHYQSLINLMSEGENALLKPDQVRLIIGATPEKEKSEIRSQLADGSIKLIIGTHALLEDPVIFQNLQVAVIDEQHRFGVEQRAALRQKGENPHLLVMTATPIPRSLALTVFGDLELTIIDEMPPGRIPVDTFILTSRERERAYTLIEKQLAEDRQAFIIYPLVEESEKSNKRAAVEESERLQNEVFHKHKVGLIHGRLKQAEKDEIMTQFRDKEIDILVSTTVVEVGVDIPNASVMLIEGANHFGLAQLHQLRGRVGRGAEKSYCLLIPEDDANTENERLKVMSETNDGFVLAESDLNQRGPGQFLGSRQSGFSKFQLASMTNIRLIEKARREARKLISEDPNLEREDHKFLAHTLNLLWENGQGDIS
ncbi:MAG: ATP-dependent DNA helicase RecG [Chloroflexi bacterium]|jgi:ATP-dependent DNA helicase RecG|nr:ATP-dependent DNA helicase RecG [Chloroflexota bacterium]MBT3670712.1 ATP-dependent DNA helicase RecG [Chloroflexota bacterium]MBT4306252.1 ATP-dependent DNA helicase RecG [Chloroflexota bacterium]MBT4532867.1 ATP-dependent DNA helicase RecG [Chloroflexota bacterium]MBT4684089.1 ATP-dependent DNA helicase RecG [Chloroflexota bacterium]